MAPIGRTFFLSISHFHLFLSQQTTLVRSIPSFTIYVHWPRLALFLFDSHMLITYHVGYFLLILRKFACDFDSDQSFPSRQNRFSKENKVPNLTQLYQCILLYKPQTFSLEQAIVRLAIG